MNNAAYDSNKEADKLLASFSEQQIIDGIARCHREIAIIQGISEITEDEQNSIGHRGLEQSTSKDGIAMFKLIERSQLRPWQSNLYDLKRELGRRKQRKAAPT